MIIARRDASGCIKTNYYSTGASQAFATKFTRVQDTSHKCFSRREGGGISGRLRRDATVKVVNSEVIICRWIREPSNFTGDFIVLSVVVGFYARTKKDVPVKHSKRLMFFQYRFNYYKSQIKV